MRLKSAETPAAKMFRATKMFRAKKFRAKKFRAKKFRAKKFRAKKFRAKKFRAKKFRAKKFRAKKFRAGEEVPGEEVPGEEIPGEEIPGEEIPNSSHKVQLRLRFDITDSSGGLWQDDFTHVTGLEFQYDAFGTTAVGYLINGADHPDGYIANYGFCGKYGITEQSMFWDKRDTARYKSGIDYYIGDESLYVMSQSAGTTTAVVYLIFFYVPGCLYARENVEFTVDWERYDSRICDPVALFHLNVADRVWSASFEGFQPRAESIP